MQYPWRESYDPWFPAHLQYPEHTMYEAVADAASRFESENAITYFNLTLTYAELMAEIDRASKALKADGFMPKDVITICLPNIPQAVILFYAVNRMGGICNMMHPLSPAAEIVKNMKRTNSRVLFILDAQRKKLGSDLEDNHIRRIVPCSAATYMDRLTATLFKLKYARRIGRIPTGEPYLSFPDLLAKADGQGYPQVYSRPVRSPAVYLHSGGTTGEPKTIVLSDYQFNALAVQGPGIVGESNAPVDMRRHSHIAILPFFHGFGLAIGLHMMLSLGIRIVLVPKFTPGDFAHVVKKHRPTILAGVPTLFTGMIRAKKLRKADLSHLRHVFCGGDLLTPELRRRFETFLQAHGADIRVREGYGLTETVTVNTVNPFLGNKEGTVGLALSDMYLKICSLENGEPLPAGEHGEICVTGPTVMLGYLNDSEATKHTLRMHDDGLTWVHTGDLGYLDNEGYLVFLQRLKRIIKVSGVPVFPSEIEKLAEQIPGVKAVAAVSMPHPYKMEVVCLFVVKTADAEADALTAAIQERIEKEMLIYAKPAAIRYLDALPETLVGKVDVLELEKKARAISQREASEG